VTVAKETKEPGERPRGENRQRHWQPPWGTYITYLTLTIMGPFRKLFEPPQKLVGPYVQVGNVVADLGCGPGYYTLPLARSVGSAGKVFAVDLDRRSILALENMARKSGYHNIEAHDASAADLSFIQDRSVDYVLANGLL